MNTNQQDAGNENDSYDIVGVGAVAVDDLLYVDRYPVADTKIRVRERQRQGGGVTGTALVAAARFGVRCAYAGQLGDPDRCELSRFIADIFDRERVDYSIAARTEAACPAHSTIIVDQTNHTRTIFSSVNDEGLGPADDHPGDELLQRTRVLLIDHHRIGATLRLVELAKSRGVQIVADFERFYSVQANHPQGEEFARLMTLVDHLIVGQEFAAEATGITPDHINEMVSALWTPDRKAVVVTCGKRGCWYRTADDDPVRHCPALEVDVVDTTGCGDVFHGVYAAAIAGRVPVDRAVQLATIAASIKAGRPGGQLGIPDRKTIMTMLPD